MEFAASLGLIPKGPPANLGSQLLGSVGRLTSAVGSALGAITSVILMIVIGIFLAIEPRIYDRGIAWMLPLRHRERFYRIAKHVGFTIRRLLFGRLLGMVFEGFFTWFMPAGNTDKAANTAKSLERTLIPSRNPCVSRRLATPPKAP